MSSVKVDVKWQKEVYNVEVDLEQPPAVFKTQLFSLTGVPIERQKIMGVKGGLLKDDADWGALGIKPGQKLTMMGTADKVPEAPKQEHAFMEDLPEEEQDTSGAPAGRADRAGGGGGVPPPHPRSQHSAHARTQQMQGGQAQLKQSIRLHTW
jgi:hypothetical protein